VATSSGKAISGRSMLAIIVPAIVATFISRF
jgi:hypothetical protein